MGETPISSYKTLEFNGKYDFTKDVKTAEITIIKNQQKQDFAIEAKLNNNKFVIDIVTPFEGFENVKINGDYTRTGSEYKTIASLERNDIKYSINGILSGETITITASSPLLGYTEMSAIGKINRNGLEILFRKETSEYKFSAQYKLDDKSASLKLSTPFEEMKTASFGGTYKLSKNGMEGRCFFENNSNKLEINTKSIFTPTKFI